MRNKIIILIVLVIFLVACTKSIEEVKKPENIGKKVTVSGTVKNTFKLGELSGYTLEDETGKIGITSKELPEENTKKTTTGILMRDSLFGYYIAAG